MEEMKVLIINGSTRKDGNTTIAVNEIVKVFETEGIDTEVVQIGNKDIRGCIACGSCFEKGKCVFEDTVFMEEKKDRPDKIWKACRQCGCLQEI